jgi:hypothetical protein
LRRSRGSLLLGSIAADSAVLLLALVKKACLDEVRTTHLTYVEVFLRCDQAKDIGPKVEGRTTFVKEPIFKSQLVT